MKYLFGILILSSTFIVIACSSKSSTASTDDALDSLSYLYSQYAKQYDSVSFLQKKSYERTDTLQSEWKIALRKGLPLTVIDSLIRTEQRRSSEMAVALDSLTDLQTMNLSLRAKINAQR